MPFSNEALLALCGDFCKELEQITHETDRFLTEFHTEERVRFSGTEAIREAYLEPFTRLNTLLLSSMERSDRLGVRLASLLASTDCREAVEQMPRVEYLWCAYEQYRNGVIQYLATSQQYWNRIATQEIQSIVPLLQDTRALIAAQRQASTVFAKAGA